jgi:hypothetical protein
MRRMDLVGKPNMRKIVLWGIGALLAAATARAGLQTSDLGQGITPQDMVATLLGGGVSVSNIQYTGATNASGVFCSGDGIIGFKTGILLTSGSAANVIGPNNSPGATTDNGLPGDTDLDGLAGTTTFDAAVLNFDFVPDSDTVQFQYVFGSEEYNEFVGSPFNDVFGFFVNGVNFALIPGTSLPVTITNVNNGFSSGISTGPCMNCAFFIDNVDAHLNTQLDGLTRVFTFTAPVVAHQVNHLKIGVADASDHVLDSAVFIEAGSLRSGTSAVGATRNSRFWFTHAQSADLTCATLSNAIAKIMNDNCSVVPLGFLDLPQGFRNSDNVKDSADATIEALGLYWKSVKRTGEVGGSQNQKSPASAVCSDRKRLAVELIAAMANVNYLGTDPSSQSYVNAGTNTTFPSDLIAQAQTVAAGEDLNAFVSMTALLKIFNGSGLTNNLPTGIVECSPSKTSTLRTLSRDPTTQITCPGVNNSCGAAEAVAFPSSAGSFSSAVFTRNVNLSSFTNSFPSPTCGVGGRSAAWEVSPPIGATNRSFTVSTSKANFDSMISIWEGNCSNLVAVSCANTNFGVNGETLHFQTDGTNTFFIVVEGVSGQFGKLQLKITSP